MDPGQAHSLGYGGPGSSSEFGGRVTSVTSSGPPFNSRLPHRAATLSAKRQKSASVRADQPLRPPSPRISQPQSASSRYSFSFRGRSSTEQTPCYQMETPSWRKDTLENDPACPPLWADNRERTDFPWNTSKYLGSKLERKARDPAACDPISFRMNPQVSALCFVRRFGLFFSCLFFISLFHRKLEWLGLQCRPQLAADPGARPPFDVTQTDSRPDRQVQESSVTVIWAETLITTGACFLLAQGFFGVRAARERMERVRHTATNLAYSFLKATKATTDTVHGREQLELLVYECLALLTAFPIALLEDARGNTCEPAVTRYCRDVAKTLKRLRSGDDAIVTGPVSSCESSSMAGGQNRPRYVTVDYFFELFSLQLLLEFRRQGLRVKLPSIAPQHILYKLRNHFENMVDSRNIDDRRTPIIRENIDMLGLAGRECGIFGMADIVPITFLWSVWVAGWIIAVYNPIRMCSMVVAWVPPQVQDTDSVVFPPFRTMLPMAGLSVLSAVVTAMMAEMWRMWDPFNAGINCYGWTQGIAMEIDAMLNEFSEYDADELVRPHAYMTPAYRGSSPPRGLVPGPLLAPSPLMDDEELGGSETPEDMAQTV